MKARDNPFRTERVLSVRYRLRDQAWEDLLDRLKKLGYRGAIVGPKGTGKTTLLEDLEPRIIALGFNIIRLRLDDQARSFPRGFLNRLFAGLTERDVILFDGAEQMSRLTWHRFKRRSKKAGGLVITSHNAGLLPTLKECATSRELLDEIIAELVGAENAVFFDASRELHAKHKGNLREALREMYDICADKSSAQF